MRGAALPSLLDVNDVAKVLGKTPKAVRSMRQRGSLPEPDYVLDARGLRWHPETIRSWLDRHRSTGRRLLTFNGETRSLTDWARWAGLSVATLHSRIEARWELEKALKTPVRQKIKPGATVAARESGDSQ